MAQAPEGNTQTFAILAQTERIPKMEAEFQELRSAQDKELGELEQVRKEMESGIEAELNGKTKATWNGYSRRKTKTKN